MRTYHPTQLLSLAYSLLLTKLFFPRARLIRFPIDIRNSKYIKFGQGFTTGRYNRIECHLFNYLPKPKLIIENNVQINDSCHISCASEIIIEENVLIASRVYITDHDHGNYLVKSSDIFNKPEMRNIYCEPVKIQKNVWIGEGVSVLKGVTIGANSVIGSNSVVTKSIPAYSIVVGNPARVIKSFKSES